MVLTPLIETLFYISVAAFAGFIIGRTTKFFALDVQLARLPANAQVPYYKRLVRLTHNQAELVESGMGLDVDSVKEDEKW